VHFLLSGGRASGGDLLVSAITVWLTNVLVFAFCYWELDRGGLASRRLAGGERGGFLFSATGDVRGMGPRHFVDYLYVSFTNATSLAPADTFPVSRWAKLLMMLQALVSLLTLVLVAAHAVNVLD